ncbi:MAG TPA: LysM peptidoglycan-binding domain-containing protein [Candidatus Deferrimicrobiaceae bacterium]|nr:LysM peptidoglycan-binding domain-containing protein [Candidatus Deferrimicrobiaceae bacterium]
MTLAGGRGWLAAATLSLALGGCAALTATPSAPAAGPASVARDPLAARHRQQAEALERDGQLRRAAEEWRIVLTITPGDARARESLLALQARIDRTVAEQLDEGRKALARGVHVEARRRFLAALALDPSNRAAFDALQSDTREVEFITHTVRAGDTLSALAQRYYGDRSRGEVIWETNHLPPNPRLAAGTTLKIPEIPGVPFVHAEARRPAPVVAAVPTPDVPRPGPSPGAGAPAAPPTKEEYTSEVNPLLAEAREALERSDYPDAIVTVDKFLAGKPGDREGLTLKKQALYGQAKGQMEARQYGESIQSLNQLARLQPDYEDAPALLRQARTRIIEQHYTQGVRYYREEKLKEAIAEWRVVLEMDPANANARRNIDQAEKLLRGLEQRMKK